MIQNILRHLASIEHYGVASLCLFATVFVGVLVWALLQKRSHLDYMARIALDEPDDLQNAKHSHE